MENRNRTPRPPIVAVLGHVDHGKTTLLDAIRKTNVAAREIGGITQHIGAYQVTTPQGYAITFIDTPGHEAFSEMRSRGANVSDIVLLVVAADDGVKPQTRESLAHINAAGVPFIVVLTKVDLPTAQPERVKDELEKEGVQLEGRGGEVVVVPVSAKTGDGLETLLEMINLVAQMHEVSGKESAPLEAVVVESQFESKRGALATVVVREGKISVGDFIHSDGVEGKVKALFDERGKPMEVVLPGQPAQILGFESVPQVGSKVVAPVKRVEGEKEEKMPPGSPPAEKGEGGFPFVVKADTVGRLEALRASLPPEVSVLSAGAGEVTPSDVMLASSFGATILGFGVKTPLPVLKLAEEEHVRVVSFSIIYEALDWVNKAIAGKEEEKLVAGRAEIVAEFPYGEKGKIAGIRVTEGRITRAGTLTLLRDGKAMGQVRINSMRQKEKGIDILDKGGECGVIFSGKIDFKVGDVIESTAGK